MEPCTSGTRLGPFSHAASYPPCSTRHYGLWQGNTLFSPRFPGPLSLSDALHGPPELCRGDCW
eukprot:977587-Rhodomonas_salina.1